MNVAAIGMRRQSSGRTMARRHRRQPARVAAGPACCRGLPGQGRPHSRRHLPHVSPASPRAGWPEVPAWPPGALATAGPEGSTNLAGRSRQPGCRERSARRCGNLPRSRGRGRLPDPREPIRQCPASRGYWRGGWRDCKGLPPRDPSSTVRHLCHVLHMWHHAGQYLAKCRVRTVLVRGRLPCPAARISSDITVGVTCWAVRLLAMSTARDGSPGVKSTRNSGTSTPWRCSSSSTWMFIGRWRTARLRRSTACSAKSSADINRTWLNGYDSLRRSRLERVVAAGAARIVETRPVVTM